MNTKITFFSIFLILMATFSHAQSFVGVWKTIDDNTNEAKSHVEIYEQNGKLYGKLVKLLTAAPDKICDQCSGKKKNKPLMGLVILEGLEKIKNYWGDGIILDPENGKEYGCSIWFEDDKPNELKVRGKHWTGIYRTQTWFRVK